MHVVLENSNNKFNKTLEKRVKIGRSWTSLILSPLGLSWCVPVFRLDIKWSAYMWLAHVAVRMIALLIPFISPIGGYVAIGVYQMLKYNETNIKELLSKGWKPKSDGDAELIEKHILDIEEKVV